MKKGALFIVIVLLASCSNDPCSILKSYGLEQNEIESNTLKNAVLIANSLLGEEKIIYGCKSKPLDHQVIVFDTSSKNLSSSKVDMLFVLEEEKAIIFQDSVFSKWVDSFSKNAEWFDESSDEQELLELLEIDEKYLLAYFLLHELGHINKGHPGRAVGKRDQNYNIDKTIEKSRENEADEFASNVIINSINNTNDFDQSTNGLWVSTELGKVSFNLQGIRSIINFGGTAFCLPYLFEDTGLSHPNFELRMLKANFDITQDYKSKELFDFFQSKRLKTNCETL